MAALIVMFIQQTIHQRKQTNNDMEEIKIQSLNVRVWTKEISIFKPHFWLWRTFKQALLFHRESPDVICLQEVEKPIGKFLLGLWNYKTFWGNTRLPIFVKKKYAKHCNIWAHLGGTRAENGHGFTGVKFGDTIIKNCHFSWTTEDIKYEYSRGWRKNMIFCGDMNISKDRFIYNLKEYAGLSEDTFVVYPKTPEGPTYISYAEPFKYQEDIDQFGYIGNNPPDAEVTVLPDKVSDHFSILAKISA